MLPLNIIKSTAAGWGLPLSDDILTRFDSYAQMLIEWNQKLNMTRITEPGEMAVKHFLDSLTVLSAIKPEHGATIADVGTGAGFPGAVLLIARPDLKMTLIDSSKKRLTAIEDMLGRLGLKAEIVHGRAEEFGRDRAYRERFDIVAARAVANMYVLSELCLPLCRTGGVFAAMKGPSFESELEAAKSHIAALGGGEAEIRAFKLPGTVGRHIIMIKKISQTATIYPRVFAKINKPE